MEKKINTCDAHERHEIDDWITSCGPATLEHIQN